MKIVRYAAVRGLALVALSLALAATTLAAQQAPAAPAAARHTLDMTVVAPETVGFSAQRLDRLHALMQKAVDGKEVSGVVTILARHGKVVDYRTYGQRDMASGAPMTRETIFRDYSMTKPVTAVAMILAGTVMLFTKTGEVGTNYTLITGAFAVMGVQVRRG